MFISIHKDIVFAVALSLGATTFSYLIHSSVYVFSFYLSLSLWSNHATQILIYFCLLRVISHFINHIISFTHFYVLILKFFFQNSTRQFRFHRNEKSIIFTVFYVNWNYENYYRQFEEFVLKSHSAEFIELWIAQNRVFHIHYFLNLQTSFINFSSSKYLVFK